MAKLRMRIVFYKVRYGKSQDNNRVKSPTFKTNQSENYYNNITLNVVWFINICVYIGVLKLPSKKKKTKEHKINIV